MLSLTDEEAGKPGGITLGSLNVLDLFSGIGGFSLGLEQASMKTVAFCEIDEDAQKVLHLRFPSIPVFKDVSKLKKETLDSYGISVDVICGGFPCQDISLAGKGAGIEGERSGLWFEFHRLIKEIKPKYVIAENVSALRSRGLDKVLRSLNEIGYDAEWHCIPASAVGAPHRRDRIWIIAYPKCIGSSGSWRCVKSLYTKEDSFREASGLVNAVQGNSLPYVCGGHDGISSKLDKSRQARLKQLGNAVIPQIPEIIGKAIMEDYYAK